MNKIKYSVENATLLNKLLNLPNEKIITNLKIRRDYIEFQLFNNDLFLPSIHLNENELFMWFSIIEQLTDLEPSLKN